MSDKYVKSVEYIGGLDKNSHLQHLNIVRQLINGYVINFSSDVTFFVGENGTGKSTLIEAIAKCMGFNAEGGSRNFNFCTRDTTSELFKFIKIIKSKFPKDGFFFRAESFYNVASNIEDTGVSGYGNRSLHEQSHGESFFSLFTNRFRGNGIYILDEPEASLSPFRQMAFLSLMNDLIKMNSQFIIATHSPILLSYPKSDIFELTNSGISKTDFKNCELFKLYKDFLNNSDQALKYLLD
ncbi:MAG: AAA family ATPase [Clostridia bacterium]|nr:AAA family ATPase [Clostridia bacterium]